MTKFTELSSVALISVLLGSTPAIHAQDAPARPDFSGVYFPFSANAPPAAPRGAGTPPRPVPVIDGRAGRPDTAPKLKPEYLAKWEEMRKSRMAGLSETDPNANCLSAGMPGMMSMGYGMEINHTKDKITLYGELNDVYRRIYLDGRKRERSTIRRSPGIPWGIGKGTRSSWIPSRYAKTRSSISSRRTAISSPCRRGSASRRPASSRTVSLQETRRR